MAGQAISHKLAPKAFPHGPELNADTARQALLGSVMAALHGRGGPFGNEVSHDGVTRSESGTEAPAPAWATRAKTPERSAFVDQADADVATPEGQDKKLAAAADALRAFGEKNGVDVDAEAAKIRAPEQSAKWVDAPNGTKDFGEVSNDIAKRSDGRFPAAPIRLAKGNAEFGHGHVSDARIQDFKDAGYANELDALQDVASHYTDATNNRMDGCCWSRRMDAPSTLRSSYNPKAITTA